ncbi:hypothetical protein [Armatimonas sp.]|uniref:hypothetical protein n=1 Tax=Armatimonas sp. TaxID=1872638 RepID=UPI003751B48B
MNRFKAVLLTASTLGLAMLAPLAHGQTTPAYTFVDLGTAFNLTAEATDINDAGQITGHTYDGTNMRAFRITPVNGTWFQGSGNINSLMALVTTDGTHPYSQSLGINKWGELAGQALGSGYTSPQNAFFWRTDLSGVKLSNVHSWAFGINDNGSVAGTIYPNKGGSLETIWRLVNGSFVATTIPRPTGSSGGIAQSINNLDQVVGYFDQSSGATIQPFVWLPAPAYGLPAGTTILPTLGTGGTALRINQTGSIVGHTFVGGQSQAALWTPNGSGYSVQNLSGPEWLFSSAYVANNPEVGALLTVVGTSRNTFGEDRAFVWDSATGMRDLNTLTVNGPQASVTVAKAVNKGGLIVGYYRPVGSTASRSFLLVPNATLPAATAVPASPSDLSGVNGSNQVSLSWADGSTDENGFQVRRSADGVTYKQIGWVAANTGFFTDNFEDQSYKPAYRYSYRISAFNVAGYSTGATLDVVTPGVPLAPSGLVVGTYSSPLRVRIGWRNNSNTQDSVVVERSENGGSFAPLTTLTDSTASSVGSIVYYYDAAVVGNRTYSYRLRSHSTNGSYSSYSAVVSATTPRR